MKHNSLLISIQVTRAIDSATDVPQDRNLQLEDRPLFTLTRRSFLASTALAAIASRAALAQPSDALAGRFRTPGKAAAPRVWWHWMNGNVSEQGIRDDLEWMRRVGIGGVQNFDATVRTPVLVDSPVIYGTPRWREMLGKAARQADANGLEFAVASSPGFSETGGPWVKPERAMKKLVWTDTEIVGGRKFSGKLALPSNTPGPFGNLPVLKVLGDEKFEAPLFYRDVAVVAIRAPVGEVVLNHLPTTVTTSGGSINPVILVDNDLNTGVSIPYAKSDTEVWIQFTFDSPRLLQAVSVAVPSDWYHTFLDLGPKGRVEKSDDGVNFIKLADVTTTGCGYATTAFTPTSARYFRIVFPADHQVPRARPGVKAEAPTSFKINQLVLHGGARIDQAEGKAGFWPRFDLTRSPSLADAKGIIAAGDVIDLTDHMSPDGQIDWSAPEGKWIVQRIGYSLTGATTHPSTDAGTGLEVDKLNKDYVREYMDQYLGLLRDAIGPDMVGTRGLTHMLCDSFEAGACNWTDGMFERFSTRRGYDLKPWLPVLTGRVIGSVEMTEAVLWDFRQTLNDLVAEEHYGVVAEAVHEAGMKLYAEAHEAGRALTADGMEVKKHADIPMGALWFGRGTEAQLADIRESASTAHVYGKTHVAAEAMTTLGSAYDFAPARLKSTVDHLFANGLNRIVVHASVHQPFERPGPGFGLGPFGQWFTRKETWAEQAGAWVTYLARCSELLSLGRPIVDIAYFYGEDGNITQLFEAKPPVIPQGYEFDYVNADIVRNELAGANGEVLTRSGMRFKLLAIDPQARRMTLTTLAAIRKLAEAGVTIVGPQPVTSPSKSDDAAAFARLAAGTWQLPNVMSTDLATALVRCGVAPDVVSPAAPKGKELLFAHRSLEEAEIYFLHSRDEAARDIEVNFRVSGREPELWRAETGSSEPVSYRQEAGRTIVSLRFEPKDAFFVVFRKPAASAATLTPRIERQVAALAGPWDVTFQSGRGAPPSVRFATLSSWADSSDAGIRYFSGTATYVSDFIAPPHAQGESLVLDLGRVENIADVIVNGTPLGTLWKPPFAVDISGVVRPGRNRLEIKVANLWPNRLIGDKQPGATPIAFAVHDPFKADSPLLPSGLLGPVRILARSGGTIASVARPEPATR